MSVTLFKRFKMECDLTRPVFECRPLPDGFEFLPWSEQLLRAHAETKFKSFQKELDTNVFSCLGQSEGCLRLMRDIAFRSGFIPESTWLLIHRKENGNILSCGTIQGIQTEPSVGAIQNIGIIPGYRGRGLGSILVRQSLLGLLETGIKLATLEVTAHNTGAIRLYQRLGFVVSKVVYRSVEVVSR